MLALIGCSGEILTQPSIPTFATSTQTSEVAQGDTLQVVAEQADPLRISWSSSDVKIAIVNRAGRVIVVDTGTVIITARRVRDASVVGEKTFHARSGVIFIGDSMTSQLGSLSAWFGPVARRWVNAGVSGAGASDLIRETDRVVTPDITRVGVILAGFNDIYEGAAGLGSGAPEVVPSASALTGGPSVAGFLDSIVVHLEAHGVRPILSTVLPVTSKVGGAAGVNGRIQQLNAWMRTYAATRRILLIEHYPTFVGADSAGDASYFQADGIHPNDVGRALLTKNAAAVLRQAGAYPP